MISYVNQMSVDQMSVDQMSVDQMSVDQMSVYQMSVDQMSVDQMSVDQMSVGQNIFGQKTRNLLIVKDLLTRVRNLTKTSKEYFKFANLNPSKLRAILSCKIIAIFNRQIESVCLSCCGNIY
jgi:hypothetical protein